VVHAYQPSIHGVFGVLLASGRAVLVAAVGRIVQVATGEGSATRAHRSRCAADASALPQRHVFVGIVTEIVA
jgi:hypothetical protein